MENLAPWWFSWLEERLDAFWWVIYQSLYRSQLILHWLPLIAFFVACALIEGLAQRALSIASNIGVPPQASTPRWRCAVFDSYSRKLVRISTSESTRGNTQLITLTPRIESNAELHANAASSANPIELLIEPDRSINTVTAVLMSLLIVLRLKTPGSPNTAFTNRRGPVRTPCRLYRTCESREDSTKARIRRAADDRGVGVAQHLPRTVLRTEFRDEVRERLRKEDDAVARTASLVQHLDKRLIDRFVSFHTRSTFLRAASGNV